MSPRNTLATFSRVLKQLRHDKRTIALLLFIPSFIIIILYYVLFDLHHFFETYSPMVMVLMAFTALFVVASVSTLRERRAGTLDRLMTLPVGKMDIILGYALAFGLMAALQSIVSIVVTLGILSVDVAGSVLQIVLLTTLSGLAGMSLGLFTSEFAKSEFQAVQFMPAFVFPQFLTCGLLVPRDQMLEALQTFSDFMPLTYAVEGVQELIVSSDWSDTFVNSLLVLLGFTVLFLTLGAITMRRQR